jgi:hypothetical protein
VDALMRPPAGDCNCVALFDWERRIDPARWLPLAIALFDECRVSPDTCSVIATRGGNNKRIALRTLQRRIDEGERPVSIQLFNTIPGYRQLIFGWRVSAGIDELDGCSMRFSWDNELLRFDVDWVLKILREIARQCRLTYGFGYQLSFDRGPEVYALGMNASFEDGGEAEDDRIARWMRERIGQRRHLNGMLRDVYPLNIIGRRHLSGPVDGADLRAWIEASPQRGLLATIDDGIWLWEVPAESLLTVRQTLERAGRLIARPAM